MCCACCRHGRHLGTSLLPGCLQILESPVLRKSLGMEHGMTGVLLGGLMPLEPASKVGAAPRSSVSWCLPARRPWRRAGPARCAPAAAACMQVLRNRDVLLEVDGLRIGNDGKVAFRGSERIALRHAIMSVPAGGVGPLAACPGTAGRRRALASRRRCGRRLKPASSIIIGACRAPAGGSVRLKVLRGGEVQELDVVVRQPQFLVGPHVYDTQQPYYVFGGLVRAGRGSGASRGSSICRAQADSALGAAAAACDTCCR
jgi:hypothetical protein